MKKFQMNVISSGVVSNEQFSTVVLWNEWSQMNCYRWSWNCFGGMVL